MRFSHSPECVEPRTSLEGNGGNASGRYWCRLVCLHAQRAGEDMVARKARARDAHIGGSMPDAFSYHTSYSFAS